MRKAFMLVIICLTLSLSACGEAPQEGDLYETNYVINVEPDSAESNSQRKVIINLSGEGFNMNLDGVLKRLPGYREDLEDYYNSDGYKNSTWRKLQE